VVTGDADDANVPGIAGFVLAGGGSTRFGRDKALAEIGGKPMVVRMCELLRGVLNEVTVVAAPEKYLGLGPQIVADRWPGEGPLGGIITALRTTEAEDAACEWNIILSCDMPFLTVDWMKFLTVRAAKSKAQVVVPKSTYGLEPLCACWRTDSVNALQEAFEGGVRKVTEALKRVTTEVLDVRDWKRFDSAGRLFWNMNTPADYEEARRILEAQQK
jgi:molybdopterin-guanine dinucleotide biosynthesis protein A